MSFIRNYFNENKRLYVIFVDMIKWFDSIYRNALWLNMYKHGVRGKILRIIRYMYQNVKCCVKSRSSYSDYFDNAVGFRQGEVMSPIMFSLFVENLELYLPNDVNSGISLDDILLIPLLFVVVIAIAGKSPGEIQNHPDKLLLNCNSWGLSVKPSKTKIMIFCKRDGFLPTETWNYNGLGSQQKW